MKIKKLLTLFLATSLLAGCDIKTSSNSNQGGSNTSGGDSNQSESQPAVATLVSISVTAPTKLAYTTADTELDLTGMVVTANYSDQTSQVVTEGFTVSPVDFSTPGDKPVTVTYEDKTDSFTVTVAQAKPTAWDADLTAKFQANLYGYVPPFFYAPDLGLGTLDWKEDAEDKAVWALGGTLAAQQEGEDSPLKPVADLFLVDGFVASVTPNLEEQDYYYIMEKAVTYETKQRYIEVRLATVNSQGSFANGGQFYIEVSDAYFYDWATSGFEAAIKSAMSFTEDIPDLPEGFRYLKRYLSVFTRQAPNGYVAFEACGATVTLVNAYLDALEDAGWAFKQSSREDILYDVFSPEFGIRMGVGYDQTEQVMTLMFDVPSEVPDYVNYVADLYEIAGRGYVFNYSEKYDSYYYTFNETLTGEQTLGDLLDKYNAVLKADTEGAFSQKGARQETSSGVLYETFVSTVKKIEVTLYAFTEENEVTGAQETGVQISVSKYSAVPEQFVPAITLLGLNPDDMNVEAATPTSGAIAWTQKKSDKSVAYADALKVYTDILDNDNTLGFSVIVPLKDVTMSSGEAAQNIEYANDTVRIELYAWTTTTNTVVQIAFYDYEPAPETDLIDKINAVLGSYELTWDDESKAFTYANYRTLSKSETVAGVATGLANALVNAADLELELLVSNTSDANEAIFVLYSEEVSVRIVYSKYYGNTPILFITARVFDTNVDPVVNALSAILDVNLTANADGTFSANGRFGFTSTYSLQQYGRAILQNYIAADLIACTSLGFTLKTYGMNGNDYVGLFQNSEGYSVKITLLGDAEKNYSNYYTVLVTVPNA